jgi:signal transduction histidine kinase
LGLSIARAIVRAHDGEISAAPQPGGGLVVTVRLPAA